MEEPTLTWQGLPGGILLLVFGIYTIYWTLKRPDERKIRGWIVGIGALVAGILFLYKSVSWLLHH